MMMRFSILIVLASLVVVPTSLGGMISGPQDEQGEAGEDPSQDRLITLTSVKPHRKNETWILKVTGKAPKVPAGCEIDMSVKTGIQALGNFQFVLDASRRFSKEFELDFINGFAVDLYLSAKIQPTRQSREVQEAISKRPDDFPPERQPWSVNFMDKKFDLGTEADLQKQRAEVQEFFKEHIRKLAQVNGEFTSVDGKVRNKEQFASDGQLDTKAYRKWLEEEIRDPIRKIQQTINQCEKNDTRFIAVSRDLKYLGQMAAAVAKLSVQNARTLYQEFGLSPDPNDISPRELDTNYRYDPTPRRLNKLVERLCDSQGIAIADLAN